MTGSIFNEDDIRQIEERGMSSDKVLSQIELFRKGFPKSKLNRPCTIGDGITLMEKSDLEKFGNIYSEAAQSGRAMKFVPASGAASRMFKLLLNFNTRYDRIDEKQVTTIAEKGDPDHRSFLRFTGGIKKFAFYEDLRSVMSRDGLNTDSLIDRGRYKEILEYLLTPRGLNLSNLPKGLIKFHFYPDHNRTPFEEHLVEASAYTKDRNGTIKLHFTVSPEHERTIKENLQDNLSRYEEPGVHYDINFSIQKPSTDTLAVDPGNRPFRDRDGRLLFRPGGHGALLENLNDLKGDIIYIKNIDNVVPDRLKPETFTYKRALGGYLIDLQNEIFRYLKRLLEDNMGEDLMTEIFEFIRYKLSIVPPEDLDRSPGGEKKQYLISRLNRPLRVCGMVKNEGEPGGGPFWVEHENKTLSLQIVESSQVDMGTSEQRTLWESSTHFNPVDLVCGVMDHSGVTFNLDSFTDPSTGFISNKSKDGKELKALELPGLWNGAMANWNTAFVEVPIITFNPVKTILDLLRDEHQPI